MSEELKPCPFCGNKQVEVFHECNIGRALYRVRCNVCGIQTHLGPCDNVITLWNTRHESGELPGWLKEKIKRRLQFHNSYPDSCPLFFKTPAEHLCNLLEWVLSLRKEDEQI